MKKLKFILAVFCLVLLPFFLSGCWQHFAQGFSDGLNAGMTGQDPSYEKWKRKEYEQRERHSREQYQQNQRDNWQQQNRYNDQKYQRFWLQENENWQEYWQKNKP